MTHSVTLTLRRLQNGATRAGNVLAYAAIAFFVVNVLLLIASVTVNSFGAGWFGTFLPDDWTIRYYQAAAAEHDLVWLIGYTLVVAIAVSVISLVLGLLAAYALARREFTGKRLLWALLLIPMMVPPMTYGISLASLMFKIGLANTTAGVIIANVIPTLPFVIMILVPFVEQIDVRLEAAARTLGAKPAQIFRRVLAPLLVPGLFTAGILSAVRTIACFELTYLVSGASTQTLVVAVYNDAYGSGNRAAQQIDAMAVIYMVTTLALLALAMMFSSPTQLVRRSR